MHTGEVTLMLDVRIRSNEQCEDRTVENKEQRFKCFTFAFYVYEQAQQGKITCEEDKL